MEELIGKIKKAAKAKQLYAPYLSASTTVHFWATQVVGAVRATLPRLAQAAEASVPKAASAAPAPAQSANAEPDPAAVVTPDPSAAPRPFFRPLPVRSAGGAQEVLETIALNAAQSSAPWTKQSLLVNEFPKFLLKVLYASKCFKDLKHFVKIFRDLCAVGCVAPCDLHGFEAFANADPKATDVDVNLYAPDELEPRLRFFSSALFKDFQNLRTRALLDSARSASSGYERQVFLDALSAAANFQDSGDDTTENQKLASWACALFGQGIPDQARVQFVLADSAGEQETKARLDFALSFTALPAETLPWKF